VKPQRIQLKRTKGFRLQDVSRALNGLPAVNVARPTKWGNPYTLAMSRKWHPKESEAQHRKRVVMAFRASLMGIDKHVRSELRGNNLGCWCKLGEPCHADVLLEIAAKP